MVKMEIIQRFNRLLQERRLEKVRKHLLPNRKAFSLSLITDEMIERALDNLPEPVYIKLDYASPNGIVRFYYKGDQPVCEVSYKTREVTPSGNYFSPSSYFDEKDDGNDVREGWTEWQPYPDKPWADWVFLARKPSQPRWWLTVPVKELLAKLSASLKLAERGFPQIRGKYHEIEWGFDDFGFVSYEIKPIKENFPADEDEYYIRMEEINKDWEAVWKKADSFLKEVENE